MPKIIAWALVISGPALLLYEFLLGYDFSRGNLVLLIPPLILLTAGVAILKPENKIYKVIIGMLAVAFMYLLITGFLVI
jgi:hypothetical protein